MKIVSLINIKAPAVRRERKKRDSRRGMNAIFYKNKVTLFFFFSPSPHPSRAGVCVFICESSWQYISEEGIYKNTHAQS